MKPKPKDRNFVHKYMDKFNKPKRHKDKKHDYIRKPKHPPVYTEQD